MKITIETSSNEQLLQALANATETFYGCKGHTKADMNEKVISEYKAELKNRNIPIPDTDELLNKGVFNGVGSF